MLSAEDFSEVFWDLLHQASGDPSALQRILREMPRETVADYYREFNRAVANLWDSDVPDYFGNHTEDTQKEVMEYTVGQGKEYYAEVLAHPERASVAEHIDAAGFRGAAMIVYWERFGEDIPRRFEIG